jgi:hypothetical protein
MFAFEQSHRFGRKNRTVQPDPLNVALAEAAYGKKVT